MSSTFRLTPSTRELCFVLRRKDSSTLRLRVLRQDRSIDELSQRVSDGTMRRIPARGLAEI